MTAEAMVAAARRVLSGPTMFCSPLRCDKADCNRDHAASQEGKGDAAV